MEATGVPARCLPPDLSPGIVNLSAAFQELHQFLRIVILSAAKDLLFFRLNS